jgi:hypothetical protein
MTAEERAVLVAQLTPFVVAHGLEAVIAAAKAVPRPAKGNATRQQLERIHALVGELERTYTREVFNVHNFCQRQITMGIPEGVTIEILERLVAKAPHPNPWALVGTIMRADYPHYRWFK